MDIAREQQNRIQRVVVICTSISQPFVIPHWPIVFSSPSIHWCSRPGYFNINRWLPGGIPVIVSSFILSCVTVHDGVTRRSVAKDGFSTGLSEATDTCTDTSAGLTRGSILTINYRKESSSWVDVRLPSGVLGVTWMNAKHYQITNHPSVLNAE